MAYFIMQRIDISACFTGARQFRLPSIYFIVMAWVGIITRLRLTLFPRPIKAVQANVYKRTRKATVIVSDLLPRRRGHAYVNNMLPAQGHSIYAAFGITRVNS